MKKYQEKHPGKYYLAKRFGPTIAGSKTRDLMSQKDYQAAFGDPLSDDMPAELRKALKKYTERLLNDAADKDEKISGLVNYLESQKSSKQAVT